MPHYKDGSPAEPGDLVRGKPYNPAFAVIGLVVSIRPETDTRDLTVELGLRVHPPAGLPIQRDYGELKAFDLVARPQQAAQMPPLDLPGPETDPTRIPGEPDPGADPDDFEDSEDFEEEEEE